MQHNFNDKTLQYQELLHKFKEILKSNRLKFTTQREIILKTLYDAENHLTPEALHRLIQQNYPQLKVGIATVYRTLSLLEDAQIVTSLSFGKDGKKYELGAKEHHDHMICTECGEITEFVDEEIEKRQEEVAKRFGFLMKDHSMQIYGICKNCQNK
jgi:Fur family ferric uptake transcriptional regulator